MPDYKYRRRGTGVALLVGRLDSPPDRYRLHEVGEPETGFALQEKFTTRTHGESDAVTENVVKEFSEQPLPETLFSPPVGFKHVAQIRTWPPLPLKYRLAAWWQRVRSWFR